MYALRSIAAASLLSMGLAAPAISATITGWNLDNVRVVESTLIPGTGVSIIYDRDVTAGTVGALTSGRIIWAETPSPGMTVLNDDVNLNPGISIPNCMVAVGSNCEGPFQSDKRVKMPVLGLGPIDIVFDVEQNSETRSYQMFHRFSNLTPQLLNGFQLEVGYGVGSGFVRSGSSDGLSFDLSVQLGPNNVPANSQFPFGLFGDASTNPNFTLDGFFGPELAGFAMLAQPDIISSGAMAPIYANLFGPAMLNQLNVPQGYFWDNDGNPSTDPLLMAWFNGTAWEARRMKDPNDPTRALSIAPTVVDPSMLVAEGFYLATVDDLRAINVNYAMVLDGTFAGDQFTLRFTPLPVPEPSTWALLIAGTGFVLVSVRRRRALTAN